MAPVTPFERLLGAPPTYSHLHVFGCLCYPNQTSTAAHKLYARSTACVLLGYPNDHRGYRCLDLDTRRVITSRHVVFDEAVFPFQALVSTPPSRPSLTVDDDFVLPVDTVAKRRHIAVSPNVPDPTRARHLPLPRWTRSDHRLHSLLHLLMPHHSLCLLMPCQCRPHHKCFPSRSHRPRSHYPMAIQWSLGLASVSLNQIHGTPWLWTPRSFPFHPMLAKPCVIPTGVAPWRPNSLHYRQIEPGVLLTSPLAHTLSMTSGYLNISLI